jgi:hypothetical protein
LWAPHAARAVERDLAPTYKRKRLLEHADLVGGFVEQRLLHPVCFPVGERVEYEAPRGSFAPGFFDVDREEQVAGGDVERDVDGAGAVTLDEVLVGGRRGPGAGEADGVELDVAVFEVEAPALRRYGACSSSWPTD